MLDLEKEYLVAESLFDEFRLMTPARISKNKDKGASYRLLKVDVNGHIYLEETELTDEMIWSTHG